MKHVEGWVDPLAILKGEARDEWFRTVAQMTHLGTWHPVYASVVAAYYLLWAEICECIQKLDEEGPSITNKMGERKSIWLERYEWSSAALLKVAGELGLTPASRDKVHTEKEPNDNPGGLLKLRSR